MGMATLVLPPSPQEASNVPCLLHLSHPPKIASTWHARRAAAPLLNKRLPSPYTGYTPAGVPVSEDGRIVSDCHCCTSAGVTASDSHYRHITGAAPARLDARNTFNG